ncbi:hypothetical protein FRB90_007746 [Tulasnella sp. 427]|nr:hypothetical protein FRB90_007746 [Tulasnella sp. 427]
MMANGNVTQYLLHSQAGPEKRLDLARGVTAGITLLHNLSPPVCHGDLKPANVLVSDDLEAVLCDFGLATLIDEAGTSSGLTTSRTVKGTSRYMDPDLILNSDKKHNLFSDVWAWACTAFEVLTDCIPYSKAKSESQVVVAILRKELPGSAVGLSTDSRNYRDLQDGHIEEWNSIMAYISSCWVFSPTSRPIMRCIMEVVFQEVSSGGTLSRDPVMGHVRILIDLKINLMRAWRFPQVEVRLNAVSYGRFYGSDEDAEVSSPPDSKWSTEIVIDVHSMREL